MRLSEKITGIRTSDYITVLNEAEELSLVPTDNIDDTDADLEDVSSEENTEEKTFSNKEEATNFLIDDENEAIEGYNNVLSQLDNLDMTDEDKDLYRRKIAEILQDENDHIAILQGMLEGKDITDKDLHSEETSEETTEESSEEAPIEEPSEAE